MRSCHKIVTVNKTSFPKNIYSVGFFQLYLQSNAKYLEQSLFLSIEPTKGPPPPR